MKITSKLRHIIFQWIIQKIVSTGEHKQREFGTFFIRERQGRKIALNGGGRVKNSKVLVFKQSRLIKQLINEN